MEDCCMKCFFRAVIFPSIFAEAIKVDIGFKNPLQIPISVSNVSVICKYFTTREEMEKGEVETSSKLLNDEYLRELIVGCEGNADEPPSSLYEADFSLNGGETLVVQLTVTPRVEGMLKLVGVRWKLSGSVVGFQIFQSEQVKKNIVKRRKPKQSHADELIFLVVKPVPRLEGFIRHLPKKSYLGELYRLSLELRNQSEMPVKNLKVWFNHPRFLIVGGPETLNSEFPACLLKEKCADAALGDLKSSFFQFPEDLIISGEDPVLWPIWFRASIPGTISLHISIYYEIGDKSGIMRYRSLRMCHTLEVLPSLDVSFNICHCPSRLHEFLVHMDVVNKASSQSFEIHQLSCVGGQWDIKMLQPANIPSPIMAGQSLSCFFKLQNGQMANTSEDEATSNCVGQGNHVLLGAQTGKEDLFDVSCSPVVDFHHHERLQEGNCEQRCLETVDFILISHPHKRDMGIESADQSHLFTHHACHCSIASNGPLYWLMDGPRTIHHDFSESFCEISLTIRIYNSLDTAVSVRIDTNDSGHVTTQSSNSSGVTIENQSGWHDLSLASDPQINSDSIGTAQVGQKSIPETVSPFIWSGSSSTKMKLEQLSTTDIPVQICVFTPGTYDLSNYKVVWELSQSDADCLSGDSRQASGTYPGQSFFLTVLQST